MGALNLSAVYGLGRASQDAITADQQQQTFDTDQAIRKQTLTNNATEAPLRQRALQSAVTVGENQAARLPAQNAAADAEAQTRSLISKLTLKQQQTASDEYDRALMAKNALNSSVGEFGKTGDPQVIANWIAKAYPGQGDLKAVKNADGSITLGSQTFPATIKNTAGDTVSAADQLAMYATTMLDPVKAWQEKTAADLKLKGEVVKKNADRDKAVEVAKIGADARERAAEDRDARAATRRADAAVGKVSSEVDKQMKTKDLGGGFGFGYANEDDAAINGAVRAGAQKSVRQSHEDGTPVEPAEAVQKEVEKHRTAFNQVKTRAVANAQALVKKGIDPSNGKAVGDAARAGDQDAKALLDAMQQATTQYGQSIQTYLLQQLPALKKK